jgi:hypothetical protein
MSATILPFVATCRVTQPSSQQRSVRCKVPDNLGIFINTDTNAYIQLNSWGGGVIALTGLQCNHNIMHGFDTNNVLYAITFSQYDPPPE